MARLKLYALIGALVALAASATAVWGAEPGMKAPTGTIRGKVLDGGKAPAGSLVFLFNQLSGPPPSTELYWRAPDVIVAPYETGEFSFELPPGSYYMAVLSRVNGQDIGPPQAGDVFYYTPDKNGNPSLYTVTAAMVTDTGTLTGKYPFKADKVRRFEKGVTAIEGTITGSDGKPVAGALIFAYTNAGMQGKPMYVSERSGVDGKYILRVRDGGTYFLKVRSIYGGGRPAVGEAVSDFRERGSEPVKVKTGERVQGIDFKATPFNPQNAEQKGR